MHEGTSSQAGMEWRCRHITGDMERKSKDAFGTLWARLAGFLSGAHGGRAAYVSYLSAFSVGSPARWSAMEVGGGV